ncbi:MAG: methyltransferase [Candidatus Heimdallarchaeota archaeon]|nr:MAG: methyltransferase [Candidatus Heimdallarchaeota archaeon]
MPRIPQSSYRIITPKTILWSPEEIELYTRIISYIDKIDSFRSPKVELEQYSLPSDLIAFILILCAEDLIGQNVVDLGCGTGRFTLPIKHFFSNRILGVDIDLDAMNHLVQLQKQNKLGIDLLITAIEFSEPKLWGKRFQVTLMNPPFGTKRPKIDMVFLKHALKFSKVIISIHKSNPRTRRLIKDLGKKHRKNTIILATIDFPLSASLRFHRKHEHFVRVDLLRIAE